MLPARVTLRRTVTTASTRLRLRSIDNNLVKRKPSSGSPIVCGGIHTAACSGVNHHCSNDSVQCRHNSFQYKSEHVSTCFGRYFHSSPAVRHQQHDDSDDDAVKVAVHFKDKDGVVTSVEAPVGKNLLRLAHANDIDLEGACEGVMACSTCHCILETDIYDQLDYPEEGEEDMLDLAFGLTDTSRLGCQVIVEEWMDGMTVQLPAATRNFYVDGHVPKPH